MDPNTLALTLRRATRMTQWSTLAANPLTLVVTTPEALDGCLQLMVELHSVDSAGNWLPAPVAASTVEFPTGDTLEVPFSGGQMNVDLGGQRAVTLLITATAVKGDGTPDTFVAGQLIVEANPYSGEPPETPEPVYAYVTADLMAAEVDAREELEERVAALEHVPMDITILSVSPPVAETGSTVTSITLTWARNKVPATLSFSQGIGSVTPPTLLTLSPSVSITTDTTYTLTADDGTAYTGHSDTASATVLFQRRMHWGTSAATSLNSAGILGLASSAFATSRARSVTINGGGQYLYFAYPASFGDASFTVNGLASTAWTKTVVSHTNASGSTTNYNVYRSDTIQNGTGIQITIS